MKAIKTSTRFILVLNAALWNSSNIPYALMSKWAPIGHFLKKKLFKPIFVEQVETYLWKILKLNFYRSTQQHLSLNLFERISDTHTQNAINILTGYYYILSEKSYLGEINSFICI